MKGRWPLAASLLILVLLGGCQGLGWTNWGHPGTASCQQKQVLRYDPYPEKEVGTPVDGTRPREYDTPPPECSRARWTTGNWGQ